jgi:hypothetical protein
LTGKVSLVNCVLCSARRGRESAGGGKLGTIREVSAQKRKMRTVYTVLTLLLIVCLIVAVFFYSEGFFAGSPRADGSLGGSVKDGVLRAALIDALSNASVGEEFADAVNRTLHGAGFVVDVYQGSEVTVDFLEKFAGGYKLVIFRVHSALSFGGQLYLFTAEPYSGEKYSEEQYYCLAKEAYATDSSQPVFSVNWGFVKRLMAGEFNGTLVVVMGCDGASDSRIAEEFVNQGAVGYVGWNGSVLLSHSDEAVLHLVEDLYVGKQPLKMAVDDTNSRVGRDPASGSVLECFTP